MVKNIQNLTIYIKKSQSILALKKSGPIQGRIQSINIDVKNLQVHSYTIKESLDRKPWYNDIKWFIQHQKYP